MTLTELRFIVVLAEEQHFGRAASRCHVSQPTLSVAVKKLEEELGLALFERGRNKVLLTPEAIPLLHCAQAALAQVQAIKDLALGLKDQLHSPLHLGVQTSLGPDWLPQAMAQLHLLAPQMPLHLEESELPNLSTRLKTGALDVLLVTLPFSQGDVVTQHLGDEDYVLLLPKSHPLQHHSQLSLAQVPLQHLLLPAGDSALSDALAALSTPALPLRNAPSAPVSLEMLKHLVAVNLAQALVPKSCAQAAVAGGRSVAWVGLLPSPKRQLALAWRANFPRPKAIECLRRALLASSSAFWDFTGWQDPESEPRIVDNRHW
ncbi:MAG: hypothetical protein RL497_3161 [Pseudomonadota bacterium]|jgi:LysR family transcriptional regulator, hydrogen peroxide-inducible genes activator